MTLNEVHTALKTGGYDPEPIRNGTFMAMCPAHSDTNRSLSVSKGSKQSVVLNCFAGCEYDTIIKELGFDSKTARPTESKTTYRYHEPGETEPVYRVIRVDSDDGKKIWQEHPVRNKDGKIAEWQRGLPDHYRKRGSRPLYRIDTLTKKTKMLWIVEGEKCVDAALKYSTTGTLAVVSGSGGSGSFNYVNWSLLNDYTGPIWIWADEDDPGRKYAKRIAKVLYDGGMRNLRIIAPPGDTGRDLADYLAHGKDLYLKVNEEHGTAYAPTEVVQSNESSLPEKQTESIERTHFDDVDELDLQTFERAISMLGWKLRYNIRKNCIEFRNRDTGDWVDSELNDFTLKWMREEIARHFSYTPKKEARPLRWTLTEYYAVLDAYLANPERQVDPFRNWLEELEPWDGNERLDNLMHEMFGVPNNPLSQWISRYFVIAPIQRTYRPGCYIREIPVLIGPQECGKSALIKCLYPKRSRHEWVHSDVNISIPKKELIESIQGNVIGELAEMAGFRKADLEKLKAFITVSSDQYRKPWGRNKISVKRRCVLIGTTNEHDILPNDPTGNTRFVVIDGLRENDGLVTQRLDAIENGIYRQLWAEGLVQYRSGTRAKLPQSLKEEQQRHNEVFRQKDSYEQQITEFLETRGLEESWTGSVLDMARALDIVDDHTDGKRPELSPRSAHRLARSLANLGFVQLRRRTDDGKRPRVWAKQ